MSANKTEEYLVNPQIYMAKLFRANQRIGRLLLEQVSEKEKDALTGSLRSIALDYTWSQLPDWRFMDSRRQAQIEIDLRRHIQDYIVELQLVKFEELAETLPASWQHYEAVDNNCTNALRGKHVFVQAEDPAWSTKNFSMLPSYYMMKAVVQVVTYPNRIRVHLVSTEAIKPWGSYECWVGDPDTVLYMGNDIHVEEDHGLPDVPLYEKRCALVWLPGEK